MTRHGTDPRPRLAGRPIRPVLLWSTLTMAIIAQANLRALDRGVDGGHAVILATVAMTALALIVGAWITRNSRMAELGLLLTGGVWLTRTLFVWLTNGPEEQAGYFSAAAAILAFTTYMIERTDRHTGEGKGDG